LVFLANENIPQNCLRILKERGFKIRSVAEENRGATDLEILVKAHEENLIIITFDRDYGELIFANKEVKPPGIIYLRFIPENKDEITKTLEEVFKNKSIQLLNKFTVVEKDRVRQRTL
jgi:predicted nuclease of predicted toxin-antitoxin system